MTSRTTKQAARAYQKAHDVPYAEALRHVMQTEDASSEHTSGGLNPVDQEQVSDFGPIGQHGGEEDLIFDLGTGLLPNTGFHPRSVPARWGPAEAMQKALPATLGVYGEPAAGKTIYLMTLVRNHLASVPTLVVSGESAPKVDAMTSLGNPGFVRQARAAEDFGSPGDQEILATFEDRLNEALTEEVRVVVYDDGPEQSLSWLLRTARSRGLTVLFTSRDVERGHEGKVLPGRRLPEATATVMLDHLQGRPDLTWAGTDRSWVRKAGREPMSLLRPEDPYLPHAFSQASEAE